MDEWSDAKKWWMDVVKFTATFFLGSYLSITFIDSREEERTRLKKIRDAEIMTNIDLVNNLRLSAHNYSAAAADAFIWLYANDPSAPGESPEMRRYENETYDEYNYIMSRIPSLCGDDVDCHRKIVEIKKVNDSRHKIYDEIVDNERPHKPRKYKKEFKKKRDRFIKLVNELADDLYSKVTEEFLEHDTAST